MINIIVNDEIVRQMENESNQRFIRLPYKRYATVIAQMGGITKEIEHIIKGIEECDVTQDGNVKSKFTLTPIALDELSEGCKTTMYVYYRTQVPNSDEIINITSCGPNAIAYILNNFNKADLTLYTGHLELPSGIECKFQFNGTEVNSTDELFV